MKKKKEERGKIGSKKFKKTNQPTSKQKNSVAGTT